MLSFRPFCLWEKKEKSESHEADILIQELKCQPKHFHMFSKAKKTMENWQSKC